MPAIDDALKAALMAAGDKPPDNSPAPTKKAYSEKISNAIARALAEDLRARGLAGVRPGAGGAPGAERRMAGGIGA